MHKPIPFIDLGRSIRPFRDAVLRDWEQALDATEFVGGPSVQAFEREMEKRLQVNHFIACANGTDALVIGLQAFGIKPGMRVAVPNMTFWAPYEAIVQIGAVPVLVDIDPDDLQMSFTEFKEAHAKFHFDAAILVHLFGWASQALTEYRNFCRDENIHLLEDGAQAYGVQVNGESAYHGASIATISFYPAKVLGGAGDGGGIMCQDAKTAELIRSLCNHGRAGHYTYDYIGWNSRMGGLNAKFLLHATAAIDGLITDRLRSEELYHDFFADHSKLVRSFRASKSQRGNGYLIVLQAHHKKGIDLAAALAKKNVGCARTYPQTLDAQPPAKRSLRSSDLRWSQKFSDHVINLPLFAGMTEEEAFSASQVLLEALKA